MQPEERDERDKLRVVFKGKVRTYLENRNVLWSLETYCTTKHAVNYVFNHREFSFVIMGTDDYNVLRSIKCYWSPTNEQTIDTLRNDLLNCTNGFAILRDGRNFYMVDSDNFELIYTIPPSQRPARRPAPSSSAVLQPPYEHWPFGNSTVATRPSNTYNPLSGQSFFDPSIVHSIPTMATTHTIYGQQRDRIATHSNGPNATMQSRYDLFPDPAHPRSDQEPANAIPTMAPTHTIDAQERQRIATHHVGECNKVFGGVFEEYIDSA